MIAVTGKRLMVLLGTVHVGIGRSEVWVLALALAKKVMLLCMRN